MSQELSRNLGCILIVGFWALVSLGDYPAPFIDDMFYIGAALNLVQHGVFSNPYCPMLATIGCADHFFANMPLHDYVLAGWLHIFGISTLSFHVLYVLLALGCSLLVYRFVADTRLAWLAALFIALAVYGLLGGAGLRADALGLLFLLAGFDTWQARTFLGHLWRNFFLGLTVITFPNVALPAMLLSLFGLAHGKLIQGKTFRQLMPGAIAVAVAYLLCFLIFLLCIDGRLSEFLSGMAKNQQMSALGVRERFQFFTPLGICKWVVPQAGFLLAVAAVYWLGRNDARRREERLFLALALLLFGALAISSFSSASGSHMWAFACLMTLLVFLTRGTWVLPGWLAYTAIFLLAAFGHDHAAIQHALADRPPGPEQRNALLTQIAQLQPKRLYLDPYAVRELYDYRLPPNAYDYATCSTTGWGGPKSQSDMPSDSVLVVSVGNTLPARHTPNPGQGRRLLRVFGVTIPALAANPYDLEILDNRD
ncbi:MAG TPA: hypothetical protein VHY09_05605 [Candidatus Methylacidiphilales bacterium]|jgi:hypothetical protein|nr:hypothetical protein [Candidatus Methylacidiphilales bacterium]